MPWTRRRRFAAVGVALACAVLVGLVATTYVGGWGAYAHWTCAKGTEVANQTDDIPVQLLNAPYGGWVWANTTGPPGLIEHGTGIGDIWGGWTSNGSVVWSGFEAFVTVFSVENQTVLGPGSNARCSSPFQVNIFAQGAGFGDIALAGPNVSDRNEPTVLGSWGTNISFQNGFAEPNARNQSDCGGPALSIPGVISTFLSLWVTFAETGQTHTVPFQVPLVETVYNYWFPANFGTWQVDNLSAPGGPGGGWAFSYSPCN